MKSPQGGTKIYCPHCNSVQICEAIPTTDLGKPSGQRWHKAHHADLQFFRRGRRCMECRTTFLTAEVHESFLDELVELRGALSQIKKDTEQYATDSKAAAEALARLTQSLEGLRALRIYKASGVTVEALSDVDFSLHGRVCFRRLKVRDAEGTLWEAGSGSSRTGKSGRAGSACYSIQTC